MLRKLIRVGIVPVVCSALNAAYAAGLDVSLGDETAQFVYMFDSDSQIGIGGADIGAGVFFNEQDDYLLNFSVLVMGHSAGRNRALQLGAGAKAYAGELDIPDQESVGAVAVGGKISYIFPASMPMALSAELFYAPDITSFGDNESLTELLLRLEIEVAPTTRFYLGYRNLETEFENSGVDYELDEGGHVGVRFSF
ncbi:MAG TPA: YfaZ family outer membrane protein [Gammaproteobacteria bacterium]